MALRITGKNNQVTKFKGVTKIGSPTSNIGPGTPVPSYGALFNGSGQAIAVSNHSDFNFNDSSWTIEFFARNATTTSMSTLWTMRNDNEFNGYTGLRHNASNTNSNGGYEYKDHGAGNSFLSYNMSVGSTSRSIKTSSWKHVALCYNSSDSTLRGYLNGDNRMTNIRETGALGDWSYLTTSNNFTYFSIGAAVYGTNTIVNESDVEISNFRFVVGTALYTNSTSITPPSSNLAAIANTKLLLFNGGGTLTEDQSGTSKTVTNFGNVTNIIESNGPFG